jgi:hypothetical protein
MLLVCFELATINVLVFINHHPRAVNEIVLPLTIIFAAISVLIHTIAIHMACGIEPFVAVTVLEGHYSFAFDFVFLPLSFDLATVFVGKYTMTFFHVVNELAIIASDLICEDTITMLVAILPLAFVFFS